jgi:C-terminal processing protease CtpA/Prc
MRMGFGLVGLLVVVAIILILFVKKEEPTLRAGQKAKEEAQQLSGRGPDQLPASQSVKLEAQMKNNQIESLLVTDVTPGGALDQYFGLQKGDAIVKVGDLDVRGHPLGEGVDTQVYEAAQRNWPLVVVRGGQRVTLTPKAAGGRLPQNTVPVPLH